MKRAAFFLYGLASYLVFLATFLYAIGFLGNVAVPKSVDSGRQGPLTTAIAVDVLLLGLFAVQHSGMARPGFKRWLTRWLPRPIERSTYVLLSSVALGLLFWLWQPVGGTIWTIDGIGRTLLYGLFAAGWLTVLGSTFLIDHFDLFGLRQVYLYLRRRDDTPLRFRTPGPYAVVRHPLYVGWLSVMWATPTMTAAHLLFAGLTTAYILVAIDLEERDLVDHFGAAYRDYQERVPMLVPRPRPRPRPTAATASSYSEAA